MRVVVFRLIVALALLAPAWGLHTVAHAQSASVGVPVTAPPPPPPNPAPIDPTLQRWMSAAPLQLLPIIVELRPLPVSSPGPAPSRTNEALAQYGVTLLAQYGLPVGGLAIIDSAAGFANAAGITSISLDPQVAYIHVDSLIRPTDITDGRISLSAAYPRAINADRVWQRATIGSGIGVAVLDSGVNPDVDLTQPTNRLVAAVNFAGDRAGLADAGGHGTHIAGTVGGDGFGSNGEYIGVAPGANVIDVRVLNRTGSGRISSVVRGIEWVIAHRNQYNIRLINLSLGMPALPSYRLNPLDAAAEIAWMRGVAVVAAVGNGGPSSGTVVAPGDDPYVLTVGATDDRGTAGINDDILASFSSWGTPAGSTSKPDVVAPGRRIVALRAPGSYLDTHYPDRVTPARTGASYFRLSGTSMATAVMTGAAALILQQQPTLSPDRLKALAMSTTQSYGWAAGSAAVPAPDPRADGSGLVEVLAASYSGHGRHESQQREPLVRQSFRPADSVARTLYPILFGSPLTWKDPNYLGIDWRSLNWTNLGWDNLAWDNLGWDNLGWDNLAWDNLGWDNLGWDNLAWDNLGWDNLAWDNLGWDSGKLD
jgi:serine protease AprX